MDLAAGCDRAFSVGHKRRKDTLERMAAQEWEDQERLRKWKYRRTLQILSLRKGDRDKGILEQVVRQQNCATSDPRSLAESTIQLPKDDRAVYFARAETVFFWGS
jgi:hypothetical protein